MVAVSLSIRPIDADVRLLNCRARLPFRFGAHTMTAAPLCLLRLSVETPGGRTEGFASDLLVPKWFSKDPSTSLEDDWRALLEGVVDAASWIVDEGRAGDAFRHWRALDEERVGRFDVDTPDLLLRGHAVSMVERAMIDAVCRAERLDLLGALSGGALGVDPGSIDPALADWDVARSLRASRRDSAFIRHTVGLVDALTEAEVTGRVDDGLPESLEADIQRYDLRYFKIKIAGAEGVRDRLSRVARVIRAHAGDDARATLDANEQAPDMRTLADALDEAAGDEGVAWLLERTLHIEQPLARHRSFDPDACAGIERLDRFGGCVIDEADADLGALPRGAALGYRGVSVKNCKGVFRALVNRARCERSGGRLVQSGEDLTNLPVVALQQDLATMGLLGIEHVERNGHHYFDGLSFLPRADQQAAIDRHPDLYARGTTHPHLRIEGGLIAFGSVLACAGFGYDGPLALDEWIPADDWDPGELLGTGGSR